MGYLKEKNKLITNNTMKKIIRISRFDPEVDKKSYFKEYEIDLDGGTSVLLAFHHIRENIDSSLAVRSSCRAAVC